jgi:ferredoxin-type protein NapH
MLNGVFTLGRLRLTVQMMMLIFTVYGGAWLGTYMSDRFSQAFPSLACAYDKVGGDQCILVVTQHQLHHRVGAALLNLEKFSLHVLLPTFISVATFFAMFFLLNKAFCGWVCPMGTIQELLFRVGRRLGRPFHRIDHGHIKRVRFIKWLILLMFVLAIPLLSGMGVASDDLGAPFCQICPSRLATTLLTMDVEQLAAQTSSGVGLMLNAFGNALFGFAIIAALAIRQPFCRICPLLAWNAMFQKLSPMRLSKTAHGKCEKCGICQLACPMDIHEIGKEYGAKAFHEDCTLCGRCAEYCPDDNVIRITFMGMRLFGSRRDYYRNRIKQESPEGKPKQRIIWLSQEK